MLKTGWKALFSLFFAISIWGNECLKVSLEQIPQNDREILEIFFQYLIRSNPFSYTLYGDKPVSIVCYSDPLQCRGKRLTQSLALEKGWKVWAQYNEWFPSHHFVMRKEEEKTGRLKTNTIWLINKPLTLRVIADNLDLFRQHLGQEIEPLAILEMLCNSDNPSFHQHDLLGILLGFGRQNAVAFNHWMELIKHLRSKLTPPFRPDYEELDRVEPANQHFLSLFEINWTLPEKTPCPCTAEQFNEICHKRKVFHITGCDYFLSFLGSPGFVDHGESSELYLSYDQTRVLLRQVFNNDSILHSILERWVQ